MRVKATGFDKEAFNARFRDKWRTLTGRQAGLWPVHGPLVQAGVKAGLGALAARFLIWPLLRKMMPDTFDPERAQVGFPVLGALAGGMTSGPDIMEALTRRAPTATDPGNVPAGTPTGLKALFSAAPYEKIGAMSPAWGEVFAVNPMKHMINEDAFMGEFQKLFAGKLLGKAEQGGLVSTQDLIRAGVGLGLGRLSGGALGALGGMLGMRSGVREKFKDIGGIAGLLRNIGVWQ